MMKISVTKEHALHSGETKEYNIYKVRIQNNESISYSVLTAYGSVKSLLSSKVNISNVTNLVAVKTSDKIRNAKEKRGYNFIADESEEFDSYITKYISTREAKVFHQINAMATELDTDSHDDESIPEVEKVEPIRAESYGSW